MYSVSYHARTSKFLLKLSIKERGRVADKISALKQDPFSENLDIKKLESEIPSYRLRVGNIRVVYEINTDKQVIFVSDIDFRGNVY